MIRVDVTEIVCVERELACNGGPEQSFRDTFLPELELRGRQMVAGDNVSS